MSAGALLCCIPRTGIGEYINFVTGNGLLRARSFEVGVLDIRGGEESVTKFAEEKPQVCIGNPIARDDRADSFLRNGAKILAKRPSLIPSPLAEASHALIHVGARSMHLSCDTSQLARFPASTGRPTCSVPARCTLPLPPARGASHFFTFELCLVILSC